MYIDITHTCACAQRKWKLCCSLSLTSSCTLLIKHYKLNDSKEEAKPFLKPLEGWVAISWCKFVQMHNLLKHQHWATTWWCSSSCNSISTGEWLDWLLEKILHACSPVQAKVEQTQAQLSLMLCMCTYSIGQMCNIHNTYLRAKARQFYSSA